MRAKERRTRVRSCVDSVGEVALGDKVVVAHSEEEVVVRELGVETGLEGERFCEEGSIRRRERGRARVLTDFPGDGGRESGEETVVVESEPGELDRINDVDELDRLGGVISQVRSHLRRPGMDQPQQQ